MRHFLIIVEGTMVSLVAGQPVSFINEMYKPKYPNSVRGDGGGTQDKSWRG